jgi:hypothetical protein
MQNEDRVPPSLQINGTDAARIWDVACRIRDDLMASGAIHRPIHMTDTAGAFLGDEFPDDAMHVEMVNEMYKSPPWLDLPILSPADVKRLYYFHDRIRKGKDQLAELIDLSKIGFRRQINAYLQEPTIDGFASAMLAVDDLMDYLKDLTTSARKRPDIPHARQPEPASTSIPVKFAAAYMGRNPAHVYRLIREGKLLSTNDGVDKQSVDTYVKNRSRRNASEIADGMESIGKKLHASRVQSEAIRELLWKCERPGCGWEGPEPDGDQCPDCRGKKVTPILPKRQK